MKMAHEFPLGKFQPGKRAYLFRFSPFSGNFPLGRTDETFSIFYRTEISENFDLMESAPGDREIRPKTWSLADYPGELTALGQTDNRTTKLKYHKCMLHDI